MITKKPLKKKKKLLQATTPKKKFTRFRTRVRSRHPSHSPLRTQLPLLPFRSVVRLGSTTVKPDDGRLVECNTVEAIRNSASKLRMKQCFTNGAVKSAAWGKLADVVLVGSQEQLIFPNDVLLKAPFVTKSLHGSRGKGNAIHQTVAAFNQWRQGKDVSNYIVEQFHNYDREYRLHVTKDGCFYTCRKMLKNDTPQDKRWFRNDSNSTWIMEDNPQFDKPVNWSTITAECVKALKAVGLDVGACDVKVQSAKDKKGNPRQNPEFIVIEINSAPSFGDVTLQKYLEVIPAILRGKKSAV